MSTDISEFVLTQPPGTGAFVFYRSHGNVIMRIDSDGITYKGQRIEDAGEAHRAFLEVMAIMMDSHK